MTANEVEVVVDMPHMGFNLGATRARQSWDGGVYKQVFESPMVRLMKEHGYQDAFSSGEQLDRKIGRKTVVIYRYYDQADKLFGDGEALSIVEAAKQLGKLIGNIRRELVDGQLVDSREFRVHLVAHSMGGLICRCLLQNESVASEVIRQSVDRVFTYATPHNGIEMAGLNVPAFAGLWDINNFNRKLMARYLGLPPESDRVDTLGGHFDPNRFFCLVGTNHRDYDAAKGLSRMLAGEMSDGLVKIENASIQGAPRAFVHRSHSGSYGIVNSEDGYQNLVRFLFGDVRVDGLLDVEALPLPKEVETARAKGREIRASYYFEATVSPRGEGNFQLTERRKETFSAVLRKFDELFNPQNVGRNEVRSPVIFSSFLDSDLITVERGRTLVIAVELAVSATDYLIDGVLWFKNRIPGEYLFRDTIVIKMTPGSDGHWTVRYVFSDEDPSSRNGQKAERKGQHYSIPVSSKKGFKAALKLDFSKQV